MLTYLLLAPSNLPIGGLELGATGLVLKMVIIQFISTNLCVFYNTKYLRIDYYIFLIHQLGIICLFGSIGFISREATDWVTLMLKIDLLWSTLPLNLLFYCIIASIVIFLFPELAGITKDEKIHYCKKVKAFLNLG